MAVVGPTIAAATSVLAGPVAQAIRQTNATTGATASGKSYATILGTSTISFPLVSSLNNVSVTSDTLYVLLYEKAFG